MKAGTRLMRSAAPLFFCLNELLVPSVASSQSNGHEPASPRSEIALRIAEQYPAAMSMSPDGTRMLLRTAKWDSDELSVVEIQSGRVISSTESRDTQLGISWSPDGTKIAYLAALGNGDDYRLYVWDLSKRLVTQLDAPTTNIAVQPPRWDPAGTRFAYLVGTFQDAVIWIVNVRRRNSARPLIAHMRPKSDFEWSPDGKQIACVPARSPATLLFVSTDTGQNLAQISLSRMVGDEIRDLSWAASGNSLAIGGRFGGDYKELLKVDLVAQRVSSCVSLAGDLTSPRFASDNRTIIYSASEDAQVSLYSTSCGASPPRLMGFNSGTTRFIRFLKPTQTHVDNPLSFAAIHTSLNEPPALYKIPIQSGRAELIYRSPHSAQLRSSAPKPIVINSPKLNAIPTIYWSGNGTGRISDIVVVEVHGGPHLQSSLRWEFLSSLLADIGIDLLSPNYEGSSGYGYHYEESGDTNEQVREIVAVCKFAKNLHGPKSRVVLMGTSYGSFLAASAAASDPEDISGLILLSLVSVSSAHPYWSDPIFPIVCFHGENDPLPPEKARALVASFFGNEELFSTKLQWQTARGEGHVFRHMNSWSAVYSAVLDIVESFAN